MSRRSYRQFCALARTLDLVGERWTLLIVRDLVLSPKRFTDLLNGLPGISTTLLSERLKDLEDNGIVKRVAAPRPPGGVAYTLAPRGIELAIALAPLARWGASLLDAKDEDEVFRPEWLAAILLGSFVPAEGARDCFVIRVEERNVWVLMEDGRVRVGVDEPPRAPDFVAETDVATLVAIGKRELSLDDATASGKIQIRGSARAARRAMSAFRLAEAVGARTA